MAEACRVASLAVVQLPSSSIPRWRQSGGLSIQWKNDAAQARLPSTSIIIPTFNSARLLEGCVEQLAQTLPNDLEVQIVVVDDASSDDTWDMISHLAAQDRRILPLRNKANMGFLDTCNYGASEASGDVLFFLNHDTKPEPGWLPPLLRRLRFNPSIGAVGSMLIYPDGTLQEAGAIVFSDGTGANFGRGLSPDHPLVSYAREVDYCSGAALAIWRSLFDHLDGFDQLYRPAYYEDTDLCMRVWEAGFKVIFEPESRIIHLEGSVHGTDVTKGGKRHQVRNREHFVKRWNQQLVSQPPSPSDYDLAVWYDLAASRPPSRNVS
jgi:GT2 family glycosyltransferase